MSYLIVLACLFLSVLRAEISTPDPELTVRTHNSTEIQACVSHIDTQTQIQSSLVELFQSTLNSTSVYYIRTYKNFISSSICHMFVYHALSREMAMKADSMLSSITYVDIGNQTRVMTTVQTFS